MGWEKLRRKVSFAGRQTGAPRRDVEIIPTATTRTLVKRESGKLVIATLGSGTQVFTLPAALEEGCEFTFKCGNAAGEILINPGTGYVVQAKATNDQGADVTPAAGTGIKNTAATNVIGDYITLVADGVDTWRTVGQSGIWASQ